ncbi:type II toxin-antitoxin system RelE/ParE family toxin [Hanamia caeni]|jgi:toxin ParE1/3/4|uniref:Toxin n=1 Tax=Hanamia caeni TaxID=2294116 RepID=A0A3M9NMU7_9BACT|nr:type II toxin-antitoxin system RelE/ParE family toxin [Hanamia caeni]RNI38825.1 type II toxin-antitoxin system RelE/ParE family toxin [Hanamia caeni]
MNYNISKEASLDLEEIWLYTFEHWLIEQADRYYNQLLNEIEYISKNPKSGKDYSNIRKGYLRTKVNSHLIFYQINESEKLVEIIRVLHQSMDIQSKLGE